MQFSIFHPFPNYADIPPAWPTPAHYSRRPGVVTEGLRTAIEFARTADEVGFDAVAVGEHHYSRLQLTPNPILAATLIAPYLERANLNMLGLTLPLLNPIRAAEEIGMLAGLVKNELLVGFFRGTPNELLTYGTNPHESREVYEEAIELFLAIFREPEAFGWLGRHYDYRTVSVWPQFDDAKRPRFLTAVGSPPSIEFAAQHHFLAGFSFAPKEVVATQAESFRQAAAAHGWTPEPDDMLYRCFALVADSDEKAEALYARTDYGNFASLFKPHNIEAMMAVGMGMAGIPPGAAPSGPPKERSFPSRPIFIGGPETVAAQIADFIQVTGVGRIELTLNDAQLPYEDALRSLRLFGNEVIPSVREQAGTPVASAV